MQLIMQQQYALKNPIDSLGNHFNPLRVRKAAAPDAQYDPKQSSSQDDYDEEDGSAEGEQLTEEELFALNKKKFAEQLKQELLASKKSKPVKKAAAEGETEGRNSIVKLNAEEDQE